MKKKKLLLLLPLLMMCLLTGCVPRGMEVYYSHLPKGARVHILAKMTPEEAAASTKLGGSDELNNYSVDGWHMADREFYDTGIEHLRQSAKKYKSIKIAVTDHNGKILKVSPEFELIIKDRNYFWKYVSYNYETNTVTGKEMYVISRKWTNAYGILCFLNFLCLIIMIGLTLTMDETNYRSYIFSALILNVPNIGIMICIAVMRFNSYYRPMDSTFADGVKAMAFALLFTLFMNFFGARKYIRSKRAAAAKEEAK